MIEINKKQLYLDAFIDANHPVDGEDRIEFKISWLLTEVAELANDDAWFKYCKSRDTLAYGKRFEEASDCLHLFVSLANELGVEILEPNASDPLDEEILQDLRYRSKCYKDTLKHISQIDINKSKNDNAFLLLRGFNSYMRLLISMGLKWTYVKKAYNDKNVKNLKSQLSNL